jgi:hypothetical protein
MMRKVTLLLPLTFNDGSAVPGELLKAIREEIFVAFGGWTIAGEVEGAYRMRQTGQKQIDRLLEVWVVVEDIAVPQLRHMVAHFGARLGQEAMYFEIGMATVEFIPSLPQGDPTDGQRGGTAPES